MAKKIKQTEKAQIVGQVFIFILAAIIFGVIVLYGYQAISNFMSKSGEIAIASFQQELTNSVESIKRDFGSVTKTELTLPTKYSTLCILDSDTTKNICDTGQPLQQQYPRLCAAWKTEAQNIFLLPGTQAMQISDISTPSGYFCVQNTGKIKLRMEGLGDKAQVSPWSE